METLFNNIYKDKVVLVTGHTGFKGSWLSLWLKELGANVIGYALEPPTEPNHFELLKLEMITIIDDIRNRENLSDTLNKYKPDIVFHMAAQPIVRDSYSNPVYTLETNILGTVNVFEACRKADSVKAIINVTSDKCYENKEWLWGYRENDPIGGYDPYSVSKGCSELITSAYRNSFFNLKDYGKTHNILLSSVRAGNVIGGGDWAKDRLIPDIIKATSNNETVIIRNPDATRPWQHVLEPLSGYLLLGEKLLEGKKEFAEAWNFGPKLENNVTVMELLKESQKNWNKINYDIDKSYQPHEAEFLMLDSSKAVKLLKWMPVWDFSKTVEKTISWYREFYENKWVTSKDILNNYIRDAKNKCILWSQK